MTRAQGNLYFRFGASAQSSWRLRRAKKSPYKDGLELNTHSKMQLQGDVLLTPPCPPLGN